jgi:phospholipid/cholesterol/gamma-HCH transport system substrate-binding protein
MSREVKVGILAIVTIFVSIWGYKFVKGRNLFKSTMTFHSTFDNVNGLDGSSGVFINGYKIGQVLSIKLNSADVHKMDVSFNIDDDIPIPKDAVAVMYSDGIMGGKVISLKFDKPCLDGDCAKSGQKLQSETLGLLGSMIPKGELSSYFGEAGSGISEFMNKVGADGSDNKIDNIVRNLDITVAQVNELTNAATQLIQASSKNLAKTMANFEKISNNLASNNAQITSVITNLNAVSEELKKAQISKTVESTNGMITNASDVMKDLNGTVKSLDKTISELTDIATKMNSGEGSLGKLVNDKELYTNLESTSKNLSLLLQDIRLNPKRYVNVSVFGKKDKEYIVPEEDPAFQK